MSTMQKEDGLIREENRGNNTSQETMGRVQEQELEMTGCARWARVVRTEDNLKAG